MMISAIFGTYVCTTYRTECVHMYSHVQPSGISPASNTCCCSSFLSVVSWQLRSEHLHSCCCPSKCLFLTDSKNVLFKSDKFSSFMQCCIMMLLKNQRFQMITNESELNTIVKRVNQKCDLYQMFWLCCQSVSKYSDKNVSQLKKYFLFVDCDRRKYKYLESKL